MTDKKKMLITGVSGMLGNSLADSFKNRYRVVGIYNSHPVVIPDIRLYPCNLLAYEALKGIIHSETPDCIIHCASLTNIDESEENRDLTWQVNVVGTQNIVNILNGQDTKLIYISTDSVFDGQDGNYSEEDPVNPPNYYGITKYQGEIEVSKHPNHLIFRTNIFGWNILNKQSLGEWVVASLTAEKNINGFTDVIFSTIYTYELARIIEMSIRKDLTGTYNCGARDCTSKFEFALRLAKIFGLPADLIKPISVDDAGLKAIRAHNLSLDVKQIEKDLNVRMPTINYSIERFYRDYQNEVPNRINSYRKNDDTENQFIQYGKQWIDSHDIDEVLEVIQSNRITQGPKVVEFENAVSEICGAKYAVAVNSGTSALHIACRVVGLESGDEVITSPITFVASANCAVYCDAVPKFVDIDPLAYNLSTAELEKQISAKTRIVIAVHFAGQSCDMRKIKEIISKAEKKYGRKIYIIEDASHALGSSYEDIPVGCCRYSDMAILSFHPVKHITTGEGGMVLTNQERLHESLACLRSHGIRSYPQAMKYIDQAYDHSCGEKSKAINPWYYEQTDLGYNYRITDIQCGLGLSQLRRLFFFRKQRRKIINRYNQAFSGLENITVPYESPECDSNFHLYVLKIDFGKIGQSRRIVMEKLKALNIQTQVHYIPVHTQPYYQERFNYAWGDFPVAEQYYRECLSIPLYPAMTENDVERVIQGIISITGKKE